MRQLSWVIRLTYYRGKYESSVYRVPKDPVDPAKRISVPGLGESAFQGLKRSRLEQFAFERSTNSCSMLVGVFTEGPVPTWDGIEMQPAVFDAHFRRKVERLKRKGIMTESEVKKVELHVHHTSCKECVFAQYTEPVGTRTQVGCELGRLDKYREQGADIIAACDDEAEFELISGRVCPAHRNRNSQWAENVQPKDRVAAVRRELTIHTDIVLPLMKGEDVGALSQTFESLKQLVLKPSSVVLVNNQGDVKTGVIHAQMSKLGQGLNWKLIDVFERTTDGQRPNLGRCLDIVASKLKGHFYTIVTPGQALPKTFTLDLDRAVVDDMARFVVLLPNKDGVGLTVSLGFHKAPMVNGNKPVPAGLLDDENETDTSAPVLLEDTCQKAQYLAKSKNSPHLVARVEDVCPSLA